MKELITITEKDGRQVVSARELYRVLGYDSSNYKRWYNKNIIKNDFAIENQDYTELVITTRSKDFALTLDFSKKLSMLARTKEGEQARYYFIEIEKKSKLSQKPMSTLDMVQASIDAIRSNQVEIQEVKQDILELKAQNKTRSDYFTIVGYATLNGVSCGLKLASSLGRKASIICKNRNIATEELPDPRFGRVKTYPIPVLQEVFNTSL